MFRGSILDARKGVILHARSHSWFPTERLGKPGPCASEALTLWGSDFSIIPSPIRWAGDRINTAIRYIRCQRRGEGLGVTNVFAFVRSGDCEIIAARVFVKESR